LTAVLGWHMLHHFGNEAREMLSGTAAGLLSCGTIGDDYGRRRTFLAGTLVLVLVRVLQGLGGAGLRPQPARRALSTAGPLPRLCVPPREIPDYACEHPGTLRRPRPEVVRLRADG
jgi:hypothetical protein